MKRISFILILMLGGSLIFAGGGSDNAGGSSGSAATQQKTITMLLSKNTDFAPWDKVFAEIERKYNIKTETELRVTGGEGENILKTRLATGDMTDIMLFNTGSKTNDINPERNCVDLSNEPLASRLTDAFITSASVNGKLYAAPTSYSSQGGAILYNKKLYQQLGLQIPKTWNEFLANCDKVQAAGKTAIIGTYKETWTSQLIFLSEEYYVKTAMPNWPREYTANRAKYATVPAALRSFEKLAESAKYLNRDYLATTLNQGLEMLATGEGAHFPMLTGRLSVIAADYPEYVEDVGVFAQPGDNPNDVGFTVWLPDGLYIYKNSPNIDTAKQWLEFWISQESYDIFSSVQKPTGPSVIKGISLPSNVIGGVKDLQKYFDTGKIQPALEFESPVKGPNLEQLCIEVSTGRMSPKDAAVAYDQDVQKQAVLLNLPGW
jgi:raffinose/stachyose/melibiose transport system substrate-binding protein